MGNKKDKEIQPEAEEITENTEEKDTNAEEIADGENTSKTSSEENAGSDENNLQAQLQEANDKYLRLMAEYDNFRKRTAKEKLDVSDTVKGNTINEILPIFDNFERALAAETEDTKYKQGVEMIFKQFGDALNKLGVQIIDPLGEEFDPNIANAINQIEDPELGENVVAQVFQKGYKIGDKVIRYAMVVVANP